LTKRRRKSLAQTRFRGIKGGCPTGREVGACHRRCAKSTKEGGRPGARKIGRARFQGKNSHGDFGKRVMEKRTTSRRPNAYRFSSFLKMRKGRDRTEKGETTVRRKTAKKDRKGQKASEHLAGEKRRPLRWPKKRKGRLPYPFGRLGGGRLSKEGLLDEKILSRNGLATSEQQ